MTWFATGFAGVVFTVETPALQRLSCAVSAVPLLAALAIDEVRRRFSGAGRSRLVAGAIASVAVVAVAAREGQQFFVKDGARDLWPWPNAEGRAVASLGRDVWAFSLGDEFHMLQSGWVDLLAHDTPRRGIRTPGSYLPAPLAADRDLAFVLYPRQFFFLPYLQELYPGGEVRPFSLDPGTPVVTAYRVARAAWAATRGVVLRGEAGGPRTVSAFGELPAGASGRFQWAAKVRIARSWNYVFVARGATARLSVDGREVGRVAGAGPGESASVVFLPRGDHAVRLEASVGARVTTRPSLLLGDADPGASLESWRAAARPISPLSLEATEGAGPWPPRTLRIPESAAASYGSTRRSRAASFNEEVRYHGPYRAVWTGSIRVARGGRYAFRFFVNGVTVDLAVGRAVLHVDGLEEGEVVRSRRTSKRASSR